MGERLKKVTDFAELRAGMIVVKRPCVVCGSDHRGVLVTLHASDGMGCRQSGWEMLPTPHSTVSVCACTVKTGLYRVVDGLEESTTTERWRERVR